MEEEVGTVISTMEGPTTQSFSFVIMSEKVKKGQFVKVKAKEGDVLAAVTEITRANRYFERAESVAEYEKNVPISQTFPVSDWEYAIADARVYGVFSGEQITRSSYPVAPGSKVSIANDEMLKKFLRFDENGLCLGTLLHHGLEAKIPMGKLLQKHLAILAMSGSGKSYLTSVMIEELLDRKPENGRIAVVVIDSHGEYAGFKQTQYSKKTNVFCAGKFRIAFKRLSAQTLMEWAPDMSPVQARELAPIMERLKKEKREAHQSYCIDDLIAEVENDTERKDNIKKPLLAWLSELRSLKLFSTSDNPKIDEVVTPGSLTVFDLSDTENARKKQVIVSYLCKRLFKLRKKGKIPPFLLVVEEAHNYAPEKAEKRSAIAKSQIIKIAREGRKFGACLCLISQRPVHLSTTALAQCNTNIILRITNPFDIDHVGKSCEGIDRAMLDSITTLRVGEALFVGEAVGAPIFVKIRRRKADFKVKGSELEEEARLFDEESRKLKEDIEAFL